MNQPQDPAATDDALANQLPISDAHTCACNQGSGNSVEQYIYSIGKIDVRFPTIGIEREFQQRERSMPTGHDHDHRLRPRGERLAAVLRMHPHLARSVCFILTVGGTPAYALVPNNTEILQAMLDAVAGSDRDDAWSLVVGRGGPMAAPAACGGLMVQMAACDVFYGFALAEFADGLVSRVDHILKDKKIDRDKFLQGARDLFGRVALSMENMGAQDSHRALNYLLVQHPGPYIALVERADRAILDNVETRLNLTAGARRVVAVILTFIDRTTGVPERLFTRIDVTEEWPFVADAPNAAAVPLGLHPFVDGGWQGNSLGTAI
jgi:hypothetical protein